jgi:hypothetical protein
MRVLIAFLVGLTTLGSAAALQAGKDKTVKHFGIDLNLERYPQNTPKEALASVLKTLDDSRVDYLLAHLADPEFVEAKLKIYRTQLPPSVKPEAREVLAFQRLVKVTTEHFRDDPTRVKELQRFAKDGEWQADDAKASVSLKANPARKVFLKKVQGRWVMEDREK